FARTFFQPQRRLAEDDRVHWHLFLLAVLLEGPSIGKERLQHLRKLPGRRPVRELGVEVKWGRGQPIRTNDLRHTYLIGPRDVFPQEESREMYLCTVDPDAARGRCGRGSADSSDFELDTVWPR